MVTSLIPALGIQARVRDQHPVGDRLTEPLLRWEHQFENSSRQILAGFVADPLQTPFGVPTEEPAVLAQAHTTTHQFTAGLRLEF